MKTLRALQVHNVGQTNKHIHKREIQSLRRGTRITDTRRSKRWRVSWKSTFEEQQQQEQ